MSMRFTSAIDTNPDTQAAARNLIESVDRTMTRGMVDLVAFFATAHHEEGLQDVLGQLAEAFPHAVMLGCTACGTVGVDQEVEHSPSMSLLVGSLPEVRVCPFHLEQEQLEAAESHLDWERIVGVSPDSHPVFIALADPFRLHIPVLLEAINESFPGAPIFGGIASAAHQPGENMLFMGDEIHREGLVGVALTGNIRVDAVVSQGCRPIGKPLVITKSRQNVILGLGGHPPLSKLKEALSHVSGEDQKLAQESLFIGRVIDEYKSPFERGDFLIHNITGFDRSSGALGMAGPADVGSTVQFHVRDAASADEDLRAALAGHAGKDVRGALVFGCNGRGTNMWPQPGHDIGVIREILGDVPAAGIFCAGEFGPVGGTNFVHGFTASLALFREP